jgi:hypothetical protein
MIATVATSKHSYKLALLLWHSKFLNNVFKCPTEKFINLRTFIHLIIHSFIHSCTHIHARRVTDPFPAPPVPHVHAWSPASFLPSSSSSHLFCGFPARISPFCPQNHHRCDSHVHRCFAVIERVHALFGAGWTIWRGRLQYCDGVEKGNHHRRSSS